MILRDSLTTVKSRPNFLLEMLDKPEMGGEV